MASSCRAWSRTEHEGRGNKWQRKLVPSHRKGSGEITRGGGEEKTKQKMRRVGE